MNKKTGWILVVLGLLMIIILGIFFLRSNSTPDTNIIVSTSTQAIVTSTNPIGNNISSTPPSIPRTNTYSINLPNALMLVDSQGRRTGKDPISGATYHEIPDTSYFEEGRSGQLYFFTPATGQYTLYVLGGQTGEYHLDSRVDDGGAKPPVPQLIYGTIQAGSMIAYVQNYDTSNLASSTLVVSSTFSSTASITSAPPNNLPPPPVP